MYARPSRKCCDAVRPDDLAKGSFPELRDFGKASGGQQVRGQLGEQGFAQLGDDLRRRQRGHQLERLPILLQARFQLPGADEFQPEVHHEIGFAGQFLNRQLQQPQVALDFVAVGHDFLCVAVVKQR